MRQMAAKATGACLGRDRVRRRKRLQADLLQHLADQFGLDACVDILRGVDRTQLGLLELARAIRSWRPWEPGNEPFSPASGLLSGRARAPEAGRARRGGHQSPGRPRATLDEVTR